MVFSCSHPNGASTSLLSSLVEDLGAPSSYKDRSYPGTDEEFFEDMTKSTTLYVGNLSFYTSEEQICSFFSKCGAIKRVIIGLDRNQKTPCGFCFVEFVERGSALIAKKFLDGSKLDDRFIRVDIDPGFREGRQFGRGRRGGQVRDEMREDYDSGRGGWGGRAASSSERDISEKLPSYKRSRF
jgi:nuclear cap-binding protein subunit 2